MPSLMGIVINSQCLVLLLLVSNSILFTQCSIDMTEESVNVDKNSDQEEAEKQVDMRLIGAAIVGGTTAVVGVPLIIGAAGFGTGGVVAGSLAASVQSAVYGGATCGMFGVFQSVGAAGMGYASTAALAAGGAAAGTAVGAGVKTVVDGERGSLSNYSFDSKNIIDFMQGTASAINGAAGSVAISSQNVLYSSARDVLGLCRSAVPIAVELSSASTPVGAPEAEGATVVDAVETVAEDGKVDNQNGNHSNIYGLLQSTASVARPLLERAAASTQNIVNTSADSVLSLFQSIKTAGIGHWYSGTAVEAAEEKRADKEKGADEEN